MKKLYILLALLSFTVSCNKEEELPSRSAVKDGSTAKNIADKISKAKQWFESNHRDSNTSQLNSSRTEKQRKTVDWSRAVVESNQDEERIYVPLTYPERAYLAQEERFRLLITTDKEGKRSSSVLHYIADNSYYKKNKSVSTKDFTGIILVHDWEDNFLYGSRYKDAKIVGDVSADSNAGGKFKKGAGDCTIVTVVWYSYACSGGSCTDPVVVGRDTYTVCPGSGGSSSGGDGYGGPLGGGGGGTGSDGGSGGMVCGDAFICPDGTPNASLEMFDGRLVALKFEVCALPCPNHLEVTLKIENGNVTNITSHLSGATLGEGYTQTDWVQNSSFNGIYTFSIAFHNTYSFVLKGIGDLGAGNTAIAHCTYNSNTGVTTVFYETP